MNSYRGFLRSAVAAAAIFAAGAALSQEKPATPMQWNLVRSSIPCTESTRALTFDLTVPPRSTQTISDRLRLVARNP